MFLHETVQHGVRDGGVADPGMPVLDRQLAGDDGCLVPKANANYSIRRYPLLPQ